MAIFVLRVLISGRILYVRHDRDRCMPRLEDSSDVLLDDCVRYVNYCETAAADGFTTSYAKKRIAISWT